MLNIIATPTTYNILIIDSEEDEFNVFKSDIGIISIIGDPAVSAPIVVSNES
jgi:hypothetical protein